MALSAEEKAQLDALTAKANEPEADEDFEIEIYDERGRGARVPYRKGRSWLQSTFGIDLDPVAAGDAPDDSEDEPKQRKPKTPGTGKPVPEQDGGYWSKRGRNTP